MKQEEESSRFSQMTLPSQILISVSRIPRYILISMAQTQSKWMGNFLPKNAVVMKRVKKKKTLTATATSVSLQNLSPPVAPSNAMNVLVTQISQCKACGLCKTRTNTVPGEGNLKARLMIVGEAPGEQEDLQGRPFVGRAGQLLEKMVEAISLKRNEIYIANVIKCRPPENRNPEPNEVSQCEHFLLKQLALIKPEVIIALGKFASQTLLGTEVPIGQLRGSFHSYTRLEGVEIPLMPTWHPAYLLRNPSAKKDSWEDLKKVAKHLGLTLPNKV